MARRIAGVMFEALPVWRPRILAHLAAGQDFETFLASFETTLGGLETIKALRVRFEAPGIDFESLLRVMFDESRQLAAASEV